LDSTGVKIEYNAQNNDAMATEEANENDNMELNDNT